MTGVKRGRLMATQYTDRHGERQTSTWRTADTRHRSFHRTAEEAEATVAALQEAGYDRVETVTP